MVLHLNIYRCLLLTVLKTLNGSEELSFMWTLTIMDPMGILCPGRIPGIVEELPIAAIILAIGSNCT